MNTPIVHRYSLLASRMRPWTNWVEPEAKPKAKYMGYTVEVVDRLNICALIRRPDGISCVVDIADLSEVSQ